VFSFGTNQAVVSARRLPSYDIAILGGGLAGLSLACRLASPEFAQLRVVVLESRPAYQRDRTWCLWSTTSHPFAAAIGKTWQRVRVANATHEAILQAAPLSYQSIAADALYAEASAQIRKAPNVALHLATAVRIVRADGDGPARISTNRGELQATLVFDGRPAHATQHEPGPTPLLQHFCGWEIEVAEDTFSPDQADLMHFGAHATPNALSDLAHFTYVLPFSPRRALIEDTWFSRAGVCLTDVPYEAHIRMYLRQRFDLTCFEIRYREAGRLAMNGSSQPSRRAARVHRIGAAGGMSRASSGYAFAEIQHGCDAIMHALRPHLGVSGGDWMDRVRPGIAIQPWRSAVSYWMDAVFLRVIETRADIVPELFVQLFRDTEPQALIRFLSGTATAADTARVIAACPKGPFIKAAIGLD
jgi:lycopene beta-cyclase